MSVRCCRRWLERGLVCLALTSLLAGCSAGLRFAYNHLDTLVAVELDDYLPLDASQKRAFDTAFQSLWRWHRQTQLPRYAEDLRAMSALVAVAPPSAEQAGQFFARIEQHADVAGERVLVLLQALLPTMQDRQVDGLLAKLRHDIERDEGKHAKDTEAELRQRYLDEIADRSRRWLGALNPAQQQAAERSWTESLPTLPGPAQRRQARLDDVQALADLLSARRQADFAVRLATFWHADPEPGEAARRARQRQLSIELLTRMDARQRARLAEKLLELAEDCEALATGASEAKPAT